MKKASVVQPAIHVPTCNGHRHPLRDKGMLSPSLFGQIVKSEDAIASQWGFDLSFPERFLNRYEVEVAGE